MIRGLILALQFLTRLPVNIPIDFDKDNLRRSMFFFPFVGMLIGFISFVVYSLFFYINREVAAVFSLLSLIIITGGLHLDGVSDTADGFFSNKNKEEMLEIMQDSHVGAFGVISLIIILLLKYVLISNMGENILHIMVFSLGNSRLCQAHKVFAKRSARPDGMGNMFALSEPMPYILTGSAIYLLILAMVNIKYLITFIITFLFSELISLYSYKKIDGITGDVLGATAEISEVVSMISFLGVMKWI